MNKQVLVISGPTATGKTALAVEIARKFHGELISADSRQVYIGLDIGVGKDHPRGTPIHLIDLITPDKKFSVAEFRRLALEKISEIHSRGHLPIVVGGTGLYINSLLRSYHTLGTPSLPWLRYILDRSPRRLLQIIYYSLDKKNYLLLNHSDVNNPRRLIRRIELALFKNTINNCELKIENYNILHLSLTAPNSCLFPRIDARVEARLKAGHLSELSRLLEKYRWTDPGLRVSAYNCFQPYYQKSQTLNESIQRWKYSEHHDARCQKTWFKIQSPATYIDISGPTATRRALALVTKWYNQL